MTHTSPPDQTVWWNRAEVAAGVLARLRLPATGDVDADYIAGLVDVAGELVNTHLDQCEATPTSAARDHALRALVVELVGRRVPLTNGGTRVEVGDVDDVRLVEILMSLDGQKERFGVA